MKLNLRQKCQCGCGNYTAVSTYTNPVRGIVKGRANRFLSGHSSRGIVTLKISQVCACGCGLMTTPGRTFISGHNRRKYKPPVLRHLCGCGCSQYANPERTYVMGHNKKGKTGLVFTAEHCRNISKSGIGKIITEETKKKMSASHIGIKHTAETKKKHSLRSFAMWQDADYIANQREKRKQPLFIFHNRRKMQRLWQTSDFVRKQIQARQVTQNKQEKVLEKIINVLYPKEYKFVGHGEFIIAGKCPDFINVNGQKKIIEMYGDYWHKNDDPQDRINLFTPYGYDTLVIWEHELKDAARVKMRINKFHKSVNSHSLHK